MSKLILKLVWVAVLSVLVSGCAEGTEEAAEPEASPCIGETDCDVGQTCVGGFCAERTGCLLDDDCPGGQICNGTSCVVGCRDDGQCAEGLVCDPGTSQCRAVDAPACGGPCAEGTRCNTQTDMCEPIEVEGCEDDDECDGGQICEGGECQAGCRDDDGCEGDEVCRNQQCGPQCTDDGECGGDQICEGGACIAGCRDNDDCNPDQICDNNACVLDGECSQDPQCGGGQICEDGACVEGCRNNAGCDTGQSCVGGQCVCGLDAFEPNDELAGARGISTESTVSGSICPNDQDFFSVNVAAGCTVRATLSFNNAQGDLDLQIRDSGGGLLSDDNDGGDTEQGTARFENGGQAIVQIFGSQPSVQNAWSLTVELVGCEAAGGLVLSEVFYDAPSGDDALEWVEIYNGSDAAVSLSNFSLGNGGTSLVTSKVQLSGTILPRGCFVVGGPTTNEANHNPNYNQAFDFEPDFQNSGGRADAVALFDRPANAIDSNTVPVDVVVYGGQNESMLIGVDGRVADVAVGDAADGESIERTGATWRIQASPTPGDCTSAIP